MSFASQVKEELCRVKWESKTCAQAEFYGILLFCNSFTQSEIKIITGNPSVGRRLLEILRRSFKFTFDTILEPHTTGGKGSYVITDVKKLDTIRRFYGYEEGRSLAHHINFAVLEEDEERIAFLRGGFLAGGSVNHPEKGYHMELVTTHYNVSRELLVLFREVRLEAKQITRKSNYVTYFKSSEWIEEVLTRLGAPISAMEVMNAKAERNLRENVNRRVNCDAANLDKAVNAAMTQVEAIARYKKQHGLEALSDPLREAACLRLENPALTLSQLAELCNPPVTKSCLNHRLRKLMSQIAL